MSMILLKIVVDPKGRSAAPEASQQLWAHMDGFFLLKGLLISSSEHLNESRTPCLEEEVKTLQAKGQGR